MQKEKKIYKIKSDKHSDYFDHKTSFVNANKVIKNISILPHPTTLESYEELSPGITEKLSFLIVKEQEHRHKFEMRKLNNITSVYRFGQLLSAMLVVFIIYTTFLIFDIYESEYLAITVCVSGFAFLTVINILATQSFKKDKENFKHRHKHFKKKTPNQA